MIKISYSGYRFPPEIIRHAIWLYLRFTLSFRDVEDLLAERGVTVSYETVRRWVNHFGRWSQRTYANASRSPSRRGNPYDNAKAESFMKTLKVEAVCLMDYETFEDVTTDLPASSTRFTISGGSTLRSAI
jgi:transposase InsO family protein